MNALKKTICWLLILATVFSLGACGGKAPVTTTEEEFFETKALSPTEQAEADEKALKNFIKKYRDGGYKKEQLFVYDDLSAYYKLSEYKGVEYPDDPFLSKEVTEEEVTDYLTGIQVVGILADDQFEELTQGTVQKFDTVIIDYRGVVDGKEQENATQSDQELLIGSGQFIDGFEEGLIGAEIGKEVVLDLKFSPYYSNREMAGKDIRFYVTVKKITRAKEIPALTVEDINKLYGSTFADMDAVRADIKKYLGEEKESNAYSGIANYVQLRLLERGEVISYPDKEVDYYRNYFIDYYTQQKEEDQVIDEFCEEVLGVSYEEFDADALSYARETVAGTMMLRLIAQKENIVCTDEQLESIIMGLYASEGTYYGNLESYLADVIGQFGPDYFEQMVISAAVVEFLVENAVKVG